MANEKLISKTDLITAIRDDVHIRGVSFARVKKHIEDAPIMDAVEVVRCKDCKHYVAPQGTYVCDCFEGLNFATDNDFCSYGERKDND